MKNHLFTSDDILQIVLQHETPCYIYNAAIMEQQVIKLRKCMGNQVDLFYSLKANPNTAIANIFQSHFVNAEICSLAELSIALNAGFLVKQIIFVGPAKSDLEITECLKNNILAIVCESLNEIKRVNTIASSMNTVANIAIRINPDFISRNALLKMGGKASQFGIDRDQLDKIFTLYQNGIFTNINLIGLHIYNGTRILQASTIKENTENILSLVYDLINTYCLTLDFIDIGGGFGVPYFEDESELDLLSLNEQITPILNKHYNLFPKIKIIIESGRFLVADSGIFVSQILDIKTSKGDKFLITDGGTNCHMAAVGIGTLIKKNFPISLIKKNSTPLNINTTEQIYQITGPLCTPGDLIGKNVKLLEAEVGDYIVIETSGAYGPTASPVMFLSHGYPAEVLIKNNSWSLIRKHDSVQDIIRNHIYTS